MVCKEHPKQNCVWCAICNPERKVPGLKGLTTNFNAHFDITQGKYFSSAEEKKDWLLKKNKTQVEGDLSPRKSGLGRYHCTKDQAKKFFAGKELKKYMKNEDLHNRKIQVGGRGGHS